MEFINSFFTSKNENYDKAKNGLKKIKKSFDGFCISFPDVTPNEIMFIKDKWETLPKKLGRGVKIMALNFENGLRTFLTDYSPNAYIKPHRHDEYEYGRVIQGALVNKLNGKVYNVGDEYKFFPDEVHYLTSIKGNSLVYSVLTKQNDFNIGELNYEVIELASELK